MRLGRTLSLAMSLALVLSVPSLAQDFQVGARAKAMGGSYTAFGDDPVAIWINPAGTALQPSQVALTYQSFTAYQLGPVGATIDMETKGRPQNDLLDPPISPSFLGVVKQVGGEKKNIALSVAYIRPFQIRYVYAYEDVGLGSLLTQTDQQFSRFRGSAAFATERTDGSPFFRRFSVGVAGDAAYTSYREVDQSPDADTATLYFQDSAMGMGWSAGVLTTLFESGGAMVDLGGAWNSKVDFGMNLDPLVYPVWDWPAEASAGVAFYFGKGFPFRLTYDLQWIGWQDAVGEPAEGNPGFQDTTSHSIGAEYRVAMGDGRFLYLRAGARTAQTPWRGPGGLPYVGDSQLWIETEGDRLENLTAGFGYYWSRPSTTAASKTSGIDVAIEAGGEGGVRAGIGYVRQF